MIAHIYEVRRFEFLDLKEMRLAAGLAQMDVAKKLNVTQCSVSLWESGKTKPCRKYHAKLAKLYKCTVNDIVNTINGK